MRSSTCLTVGVRNFCLEIVGPSEFREDEFSGPGHNHSDGGHKDVDLSGCYNVTELKPSLQIGLAAISRTETSPKQARSRVRGRSGSNELDKPMNETAPQTTTVAADNE
jgi:hypothetical protein